MNLPRIHIGLRLQMLFLSVFLFVIPWLGYQYIDAFEQQLLDGQKQSLMSTASTAAGALQEDPNAFFHTSAMNIIDHGRDLYAYELSAAPKLDGNANDWHEHLRHARSYGREDIIETYAAETDQLLNFDHITGVHDKWLYALFKVSDHNVVYREINSISVHRNDNLQIVFATDEDIRRYTIAAMQPGPIRAFAVAPREQGGRALSFEPRIEGYWRTTEDGYNLEIRIPRDMIGNHLGFAIANVDNANSRDVITIIGTSNIYEPSRIGTITIPSEELGKRLSRLGYNSSRILVLDQYGRVLGQTGNITRSYGIWHESIQQTTETDKPGWFASLFVQTLDPPYRQFVDHIDNAANVPGRHVDQALNGIGATGTRLSSDGAATIMAAAQPVIIDSEIAGAVVAEQTTNDIVFLRNAVIARLINISAVVILAGAILLLIVGSILAWRIKQLRIQFEESVDTQGRVKNLLPTSPARDEIGELARSFAESVARLWQYNTYLEDMSRRLTHELRTPITVVRSSLDNLGMQALNKDQKVYVERANNGIHRLAAILNSMSEATRLEQSLEAAEPEMFDLTEVVKGCVQGYESGWPDQVFALSIEAGSIRIDGVPDLIAQMLDKLVSNAVEFAEPGTPIKVRLTAEDDNAVIRVINDGPGLPEPMRDRLFDSMVSVRSHGDGKGSHLGLGLYIARIITEYHGGRISLTDREDTEGVVATVYLPTLRSTSFSSPP
ncbi:MAG: proteobacterial dedicated sortase system histidine kinase [Pseudomonadales bacterium]